MVYRAKFPIYPNSIYDVHIYAQTNGKKILTRITYFPVSAAVYALQKKALASYVLCILMKNKLVGFETYGDAENH